MKASFALEKFYESIGKKQRRHFKAVFTSNTSWDLLNHRYTAKDQKPFFLPMHHVTMQKYFCTAQKLGVFTLPGAIRHKAVTEKYYIMNSK